VIRNLHLIHQVYGDDAARQIAVSGWSRVIKKSKPPVPLSSWSLWQMVCSTFLRSGRSVVRSIACQGGYFKKETVTAPPQSSNSM